jgi:hypothetical protein
MNKFETINSLKALFQSFYDNYSVKQSEKDLLNERFAKSFGFHSFSKLLKFVNEANTIYIPAVRINDENIVTIDSEPMSSDLFDKQLVGYDVRSREELINDLIHYIADAQSSNNDASVIAMKEDLIYLMNLSDEYVFSSNSTNHYIAASDSPAKFSAIASSIIDADANLLRQGSEAFAGK